MEQIQEEFGGKGTQEGIQEGRNESRNSGRNYSRKESCSDFCLALEWVYSVSFCLCGWFY